MMKASAALMFAIFFLCSIANAQPYKMGLGLRFSTADAVVGNSISFKYFLKEQMAVETLLSFGDPLAVGLLLAKHRPFGEGFSWLYDGGGYVGFSGPGRAGFQGILGIDYKAGTLPVNLSLDWKPELNLSKEFSFEPAVLGISARFTLK
ncbi:MAG TPA: hypothetical protein VFR58_05640 [Flavisolibacter sp.]|nr:hypothetical protein [Flavisolibacter sp.]